MKHFREDSHSTGIGILLVIIAGVCWGLLSIFVRRLNQLGFNSIQLVCMRAYVTTLLLLVYFLVADRSKLKIHLKDLWMFIGSGVISTAFFNYCYFASIIRSGAAISVVLLYTSPIFVLLMSAIFFHERITRNKIPALFLTFTGCVLTAGVFGADNSISAGALLLGLGAGFGYALYSIFAGIAIRKYSSLTITFYRLLFTAVAMTFLTDINNLFTRVHECGTDAYLYTLGIAVVCTLIPYACYTSGLGRMEASRAAVLVTVEPLVGTLLGVLAYGESFDLFKAIGILMIFSAVVMLSVRNSDNRV